jgi:hypothetical protein
MVVTECLVINFDLEVVPTATLYQFFRPLNQKKFHISIKKQSTHIIKMREERWSILDDIRNFHIEHEPVEFSNWLYVVYDTTYTNFLQNTMNKVKELLERFESFWALFPNWRAMKLSIDKLDSALVLRISLLYMWYNNLDNLFKKIREV